MSAGPADRGCSSYIRAGCRRCVGICCSGRRQGLQGGKDCVSSGLISELKGSVVVSKEWKLWFNQRSRHRHLLEGVLCSPQHGCCPMGGYWESPFDVGRSCPSTG